MKIRIFFVLILILPAIALPGKKKMNHLFYVQNTLDGFGKRPMNAIEKAGLVKSVGFEGLEGMGYPGFFELKKALDDQGLLMPVNYVGIKFEPNSKIENPSLDQIREMIRATSKGALVYVHLTSKYYKNDRENGDKAVAGILRELADFASTYKVRLSAYPHLGLYCETVSHSVKLAKMVGRKNYGAVMNLCHLLRVEGSAGIEAKIKEFTPYLFAVNICGADDGETRAMGWERLIQPLGRGSFDTYRFVKLLVDHGYKGPIGLQCYNLTGDARETLTQSMQSWKSYQKRYSEEK